MQRIPAPPILARCAMIATGNLMRTLTILLLAGLLAWGCAVQEEQQQTLENSAPEDVKLLVSLGGSSRAERFLGTFDEINKLTLDLTRNFDNREVVSGFPLTRDNTSRWSGTINNLIVSFDYTIIGHAYKSSDNSTYLEIFRGETQHTVTSGTNSLALRLTPLLDDRELSVPRITRINRPFQMEKADNASIAVSVANIDLQPLQYRFRSINENTSLPLNASAGGYFSPASGSHSSDNGSYPDIVTTYNAPDAVSAQKLQVRVSNDLEIGVTASFKTYVTGPTDSVMTVDTNPVIESISGERLDNSTLKWTLLVSDDEPFSQLVSQWEYLAGEARTFDNLSYHDLSADSTRSNVGVGRISALMRGYEDADSGILQVTVCEDGSNNTGDCFDGMTGSTTVTLELVANAYQQPIICESDSDGSCGTLSDSVTSELESNLTSTSSASNSRSAGRSASRVVNTSLSSSQITLIVESARQAVNEAGLNSSADLIELMPKIIEGAQAKLASIGLADSAEKIKVIKVIVNSLVKSLEGRSRYLPGSSAETGATATETVLKKITGTAVANLDEAGLSPTDVGTASGEVVGTMVSSLGAGGVSASELGGAIDRITAGAVGSLDQIPGFDTTSVGEAIGDITGGATAALGEISVAGFSSDNLSTMVEKVTAGATSALGDISKTGYSADHLSTMVEKVTAGAVGALGRISMSGYDADKLAHMMERVTAGATGALGRIRMTGYDASRLPGMMERVTAGATAALGEIEMSGFSVDNLAAMVEKVTSGATGALGSIEMDGYDADRLTHMMERVTAGATGALGRIRMTGYDSSKLPGMMEKVTAGATGALGHIRMTGYDSSKLPGMMEKVTAGASGAIGSIQMSGFSSDNQASMIEKAKGGATGALGGIQMTGYDSSDVTEMIDRINTGAASASSGVNITCFSREASGLYSMNGVTVYCDTETDAGGGVLMLTQTGSRT